MTLVVELVEGSRWVVAAAIANTIISTWMTTSVIQLFFWFLLGDVFGIY
jgi:hypothetical protein